jgi:acetyl esterase
MLLRIVRQPDSVGLDPSARRIVEALSARPNLLTLSAPDARRVYRESRGPYLWPLDEVAEIHDFGGNAGIPPLRLFRPIVNGFSGPRRTYVFLHGGGWTVGDLSTYEPLCRRLAWVLGANILWVEYRLAPEHPFPAPLDDALAACEWLFENTAALGLDPAGVGLIGDSAGANLAAVAAIQNRDGRLGGRFVAQVLIYPCLDLTRAHPSHAQLADGFLLTAAVYKSYIKNYLAGHDPRDPDVSPLHAEDVSGVAPAIVLHAGFDPLRDEAIAYCAKLRRSGSLVRELAFTDMIHGFLTMGGALTQANDALGCIRSALQSITESSVDRGMRSRSV